MGGTELTSYCLAIAGIVLVATSAIAMLRRSLMVEVANKAIVTLVERDALDELVTLCAKVPRTYLDAVRAAALAADPPTAFDATGARLDLEWRQLADRGLTGTVLAVGAALLAWRADLMPIPVLAIAGIAMVCGVNFVLRRGAIATALDRTRVEVIPLLGRRPPATAIPAPLPLDPPTGMTKPPASMLALLTKGKLPFATIRKPSLRDGTCPLCDHATVITVERKDTRFKTHVCAACGYAQDFADLSKL